MVMIEMIMVNDNNSDDDEDDDNDDYDGCYDWGDGKDQVNRNGDVYWW